MYSRRNYQVNYNNVNLDYQPKIDNIITNESNLHYLTHSINKGEKQKKKKKNKGMDRREERQNEKKIIKKIQAESQGENIKKTQQK